MKDHSPHYYLIFTKNRAELLEYLAEFHEDKQLFELLKFMIQELHLTKEAKENQKYLKNAQDWMELDKIIEK